MQGPGAAGMGTSRRAIDQSRVSARGVSCFCSMLLQAPTFGAKELTGFQWSPSLSSTQ